MLLEEKQWRQIFQKPLNSRIFRVFRKVSIFFRFKARRELRIGKFLWRSSFQESKTSAGTPNSLKKSLAISIVSGFLLLSIADT